MSLSNDSFPQRYTQEMESHTTTIGKSLDIIHHPSIVATSPTEISYTSMTENDQLRTTVSSSDDMKFSENVQTFINLLQVETDDVKYEAISSILHILSMNHVPQVIDADGIPAIVNLLNSECYKILQQAAECIRLIAVSSAEYKNIIMKEGGLMKLLQIIKYQSSGRLTTSILKSIPCFFIHPVPSIDLMSSSVPLLIDLLHRKIDNDDVVLEACNLLTILCRVSSSYTKMIQNLGAKSKLHSLLSDENETIVAAALRLLRCFMMQKESFHNQDDKSMKHEDVARSLHRNFDSVSGETSTFTSQPLLSPTECTPSDLEPLDVIACENVELFKLSIASSVDYEAGERDVAVVYPGQIGLRCVHCGSLPFSKAPHSTVFPGSISNIAACLRLMASDHFLKCITMPLIKKDAIECCMGSKLTNRSKTEATTTNFDSTLPLINFCKVLCDKLGITNRNPIGTGLVLINSNQNSAVLKYVKNNLTIQPNPKSNVREVEGRAGQSSEPLIYQEDPFHLQMTDSCYTSTSLYFFQDYQGVWSCRYCISVPPFERAPGSKWNGPEPPYQAFVDQHLGQCFHFQESLKMYQQTFHQNYHPNPCTPTLTLDCDQHFQNDSVPTTTNTQTGKDCLDTTFESFSDTVTHQKETELVKDEDRSLLTEFTFAVIQQLRVCKFAPEDVTVRGGSRKHVEIGFGGLECIHCINGCDKFPRKYFWTAVDRLRNSFAEIANHLIKCHHCPDDVKAKLATLKVKHHSQIRSLPRGSQKIFFDRMWKRMQENSKNNESGLNERNRPVTSNDQESYNSFSHEAEITPFVDSVTQRMILGTDEDINWLSESECLVRQTLSIFCATKHDINYWNKHIKQRRKIIPIIGQVGLCCKFCYSPETSDDCEYGQVCYPTSLEKIFECVKSFSQLHMQICSKSPQYVKEKARSINISSYISEACKQYYIYSAQKSGLLNDDEINIIRFQPTIHTGRANSPDQIPNEDHYMNAMLVTPHSNCKRKFDDVDAERKAVSEI